MFCIFEWLLLKTYLIKFLNSPYSSRPYGRLLENQKTVGSRELFPPENDFQNSSTKIFQKKHSDFEGPETNWRHEIQTWIFVAPLPYTYELNII